MLCVYLLATLMQLDHPELRSPDKLKMVAAIEQVAADLSTIPDRNAPDLHFRDRISRLVLRVEWPNLRLSKEVGEEVLALQSRSSMDIAALETSAALVLSAWDVELKRPQFVGALSRMVCTDRDALLKKGKKNEAGNSYLSSSWPWLSSPSGRLELRPFRLANLVGTIRFDLSEYVKTWTRVQRSGSSWFPDKSSALVFPLR